MQQLHIAAYTERLNLAAITTLDLHTTRKVIMPLPGRCTHAAWAPTRAKTDCIRLALQRATSWHALTYTKENSQRQCKLCDTLVVCRTLIGHAARGCVK